LPGGAPIDSMETTGQSPAGRESRNSPARRSHDMKKRVAVFGWGLVAPGAENIDEFEKMLAGGASHLEPFRGFGQSPFLVGEPKFRFEEYEPWISARFPKARFKQLVEKMDATSLYAVGSFIQALQQNPGLERLLVDAGDQSHVYVGNALGAYPTLYKSSIDYYRALRRWNRFWSTPERNAALRAYLTDPFPVPVEDPAAAADPDQREAAEDAWFSYWAERSDQLKQYLERIATIESPAVTGDVAQGKMKVLRDKRRHLGALAEEWGAPPAPWESVSANVLWNIPNTPASQISMLGKITGLAFAPIAACSTFGIALKLGIDAIERGEARFVVLGSADPPPHSLSVGAFYGARVLSADGQPSKPLTGLKGTHVAGGACVWIVGDLDEGLKAGLKPLGIEPLAVGTSSDADHIITPSEAGPRAAMRQAMKLADVAPADFVTWDLHATATPGDYTELVNLQSVLDKETRVTARKGTFGHGMGVGGGWELTAQYLGLARGLLYPTVLSGAEPNPAIVELGQHLVLDREEKVSGAAGKLSMGVGGINACVVSRPFGPSEK
jgi:3-oxoacyl-[acyl-carrier-protein] synthase II